MRNAIKLTRRFLRNRTANGVTARSPTTGLIQLGQRCSACLTLHSAFPAISSHPSCSFSNCDSLRPSRDPISGSSFSRYVVFRREFHATRSDFHPSQTKPDDDGVGEGTASGKGEVAAENTDGIEDRLSLKEEEKEKPPKRAPLPLPPLKPDGEIGFIEGKIDQIRLLDVRESKREEGSMAPSKAKKKSSDLKALEKFDIIVAGEETQLAAGPDPPRTFQLVDDE